jgi:4-amino-4-deoxy-L-arabinose transferase-like glycosyltransferase
MSATKPTETDEAKPATEDSPESSTHPSEPTAAEGPEAEGDDLVVPGNPLRWRALYAIALGGVPAFLLMAKNGQNGWGIPLGFLFICICSFGLMDLLGTFDDSEGVESETTLRDLAPSIGTVVGLALVFGVVLSLAQSAILSPFLAAGLVPGSFIALVAAFFALGKRLGPWRTDETGKERPLTSRHGFWVVVVGALLYMPLLGSYGLWDPWETHYGEVAREILSRDDWISLWWAKDGWFWSKPVLNFWIQSLSMGSLGTHFHPDQFLIAANGTPTAHPEWVMRTPNVLMTIAAMYLLYKGVAKVFGRRAGFLGAIVLGTMPDWWFLAHQTMTDMPFVSAMTATMGLLLLGLNTDEEAKVRLYEVECFGRKLRLSLWHLVFGAVLLCTVPQILYLLSRNVEFVVFGSGPKGFRIHWDEFTSGSPGNCGLPGNDKCKPHFPAGVGSFDAWYAAKTVASPTLARFGIVLRVLAPVLRFEPAVQAVLWGFVLGGLLYLNWGERRARRLIYIASWFCAAIATMAKGPAGFGIPVICAFAYVATKKRWDELLRFELVSGLLMILALAIPWYVAMYVRHGSPFTDRLIFQDMISRSFGHVHDTNEGADVGIRYYVQELGYAMFPWTGIVPLALLWGFRRSDSALARVFTPRATATTGQSAIALRSEAGAAVGDASVMLLMWFLFSFALFTFMGTKFHHYIFPAVPPAAMLVGVVLDDMLGDAPVANARSLATYLVGLALSALLATAGAIKLWPGSLFGAKPDADATGSWPIGAVLIAAGALVFVVTMQRAPRSAASEGGDAEDEPRKRHDQLMFGAAALAGAFATVLVGRDLALKTEPGEGPGSIRLLQLFTYNYKRPWPDTIDFSAALAGFTLVAALIAITLSVRSLRRHAVAAACTFAILWAIWGLDVYMVEITPHWGQRELVQAYYRARRGPEEQLVAYHMNWKGENIYTGNRVPAWISSGADFQKWMKEEREKGTKVMYFVTEHNSMGGLRSEVSAKSYTPITDAALNNKFVLVRADL